MTDTLITLDTEESLQQHLDAFPDDHTARLILADLLDERCDPRAAGYRALGRRKMRPCHLRPVPSSPEYDHWMFQMLNVHPNFRRTYNTEYTFDENKPGEKAWFRAFCEGVFGSHHKTRRLAEDAAALAYRPEFEETPTP